MATPSPPPAPGRRLRRAAVLACLLAAALVACQALLVSVFVVTGGSMAPTLVDGERVLVLRRPGRIARGDVLVFRNPHDPAELLVKRVLALPAETITAAGGQVWVGDLLLAEPYARPGTAVGDLAPARVPGDHYFVVGDDRANSMDSRRFGPIPRELVVGKVLCSLWRGPG